MVYVKDVQLAPGFYRDLLGFKLVDEYRHEGKPVYCEVARPWRRRRRTAHGRMGNLAGQRGGTLVL